MGWQPITCAERDELYASQSLRPANGFTDLAGSYGEPYMLTEWCDVDDRPVLRDQRWPRRDGKRPDARACQHDRWETRR